MIALEKSDSSKVMRVALSPFSEEYMICMMAANFYLDPCAVRDEKAGNSGYVYVLHGGFFAAPRVLALLGTNCQTRHPCLRAVNFSATTPVDG